MEGEGGEKSNKLECHGKMKEKEARQGIEYKKECL